MRSARFIEKKQTPPACERSLRDDVGRAPERRRRSLPVVPLSERFIRINEVLQATGLSRTTLYRLISRGSFPPPVQISDSAVAWRGSEVLAWMESRAELRCAHRSAGVSGE